MSVEMLQTSSLVCFIVAGMFLIAAIVLFFVLDVPALVGELTGATERKAIESIRMQNEDNVTGVRPKQNKIKNAPKAVVPQPQREADGSPGTAKLSTAKLQSGSEATTVLNAGDNATTLLSGTDNVTTVLNYGGNETTVLHQNANETTVLAQPVNETTVLSQGVQNVSEVTVSTQGATDVYRPVPGFSVQVAFEYASSQEVID